jgi:hypothetical protein
MEPLSESFLPCEPLQVKEPFRPTELFPFAEGFLHSS